MQQDEECLGYGTMQPGFFVERSHALNMVDYQRYLPRGHVHITLPGAYRVPVVPLLLPPELISDSYWAHHGVHNIKHFLAAPTQQIHRHGDVQDPSGQYCICTETTYEVH